MTGPNQRHVEPTTPTLDAAPARSSSRSQRLSPDAEAVLGALSSSMRRLAAIAARVAEIDATVLITGESGVGKERLARFIHAESPRARGPFIAVNCGALPDALFESELFGHARGAFTGAMNDRAGLFEAADRGTILLDEIGELSLPMQVKLLRALQEREVRRVGENRERRFDARVIAATNRNLTADVSAGRFRRDLLYRLRVVELEIPPLRERREDLRALATTLLARISRDMRRDIVGYSDEAIDWILQYPWPGNVRELENALARACALALTDRITLEDLPEEVRGPSAYHLASETIRPLRDVERDYIMAILTQKPRQQVAHGGTSRHRECDVVSKIETIHAQLIRRRGRNDWALLPGYFVTAAFLIAAHRLLAASDIFRRAAALTVNPVRRPGF